MISTRRKGADAVEIITGAEMDAIETAAISGTPLMGEAILDQVVAEPTIDRYLDRSPKLLTEKDYAELVALLQRKRAIFITAEQKRKEPKIEGEDENETQV